jgi:Putative transposase
LRTAFRRNQKLLYGLLMQVSAAAVKDLCAQKRHLGALPGILSVLHTWNGQLGYHPHVHLLITGGGITADGQHWEPARGKLLVPVAVLFRTVAAQFCAALTPRVSAVSDRGQYKSSASGAGMALATRWNDIGTCVYKTI